MRKELWTIGHNHVASSDGWSVSLLDSQTLEYDCGNAVAVVNVDYSPADQTRRVHASEAAPEFFPHVREHLHSALRLLKGRYVID